MMFSESSSVYLDQARLLLRILPMVREFPEFALKGGTAMNFFIRDLPRLSVDIDLTYLPIQSRHESLVRITESMVGLKTTIQKLIHGSTVTERRTGEGYIRGLLVRTDSATVKIEPNHVIRGTVFPTSVRSLVPAARDFFETDVEFPVLSLPDLYAGKICAALDRQHPRDLFDAGFILDSNGLTDQVMKAFLIYVISHPRPMAEVLSPRFKDIHLPFERELEFMTSEPVRIGDLLETRVQLIREIHRQLTPEDKLFLLSVKSGEPDWKLHPVSHIQTLPAVQWKLQNIAALTPPKHDEALRKLRLVLERD